MSNQDPAEAINEGRTQSRSRTSKVWLDYDQAALDEAYDQTAYAPNVAHVIARMLSSSVRTRQRLGDPQIHSYGGSPIETLSYYPALNANSPIHIHIHGGGWRQRKAETLLFPAEAFVNAGIGFGMLDFTGVDEVDGGVKSMLAQICRGLAWVAQNARELGGDPLRLYLSGFSSGAHLASAAITCDWNKFGLARKPYKGAFLFGGIYDLRPLRLANVYADAGFTDEIESETSAQRHVDKISMPVILADGACESPEFQRHTADFAAALRKSGKIVQVLRCENYNHYELMESFGNPYSPLGHAAITQALQP